MNRERKEKGFTVFDLVLIALLVALNIVLERVLGVINASSPISFGISFIAIAFAASRYGVLGAVIVSGLGDFIGALLFSGGANPFFTLTAVVMGVIYGLALDMRKREYRFYHTLLAVIPSQIICSLFLNSLFFSLFFSQKGFWAIFLTRLTLQVPINTALQLVIIPLCMTKVFPKIKIPKK